MSGRSQTAEICTCCGCFDFLRAQPRPIEIRPNAGPPAVSTKTRAQGDPISLGANFLPYPASNGVHRAPCTQGGLGAVRYLGGLAQGQSFPLVERRQHQGLMTTHWARPDESRKSFLTSRSKAAFDVNRFGRTMRTALWRPVVVRAGQIATRLPTSGVEGAAHVP
jgi:hypothetical protein